MGGVDDPGRGPVWARRNVAISTCPKSYVTGQSYALVEEFLVRRRLGGVRCDEMSAKDAEAFAILEREFVAEIKYGQHSARQAL